MTLPVSRVISAIYRAVQKLRIPKTYTVMFRLFAQLK